MSGVNGPLPVANNMNKGDLEVAKSNIQIAKNGVFNLSALVSAITTQIRKVVHEKINSLNTDYATKKLALTTGQKMNPTLWLNTIKKSKRQGQKIIKRLKKYDEIVQLKRSEFMDLYSKTTNNLMECTILFDRVEINPPTQLTEILKFQQETKRFISKIIKINVFINKLNYKLEQFAAFGEFLQKGIFLFPGENYPAFEIETEISTLGVVPDDEQENAINEITKDLLAQIPKPSSKIAGISLDRFGVSFQDDFLTGMEEGVLDRNTISSLALGRTYDELHEEFGGDGPPGPRPPGPRPPPRGPFPPPGGGTPPGGGSGIPSTSAKFYKSDDRDRQNRLDRTSKNMKDTSNSSSESDEGDAGDADQKILNGTNNDIGMTDLTKKTTKKLGKGKGKGKGFGFDSIL